MMEIAEQKVPSLWVALLWKDFQQVKPTFVAVLAGVFSVQLILLIAGASNPVAATRAALFGGTVTFACLGPILLALGCSGMLIGQERQTGTWAWSSSLPVSWFQALNSKLLVSIVGSLVASAPLTIIPIGLLITHQLEIELSSNVAIYVLGLTLVIFLEVVVFCFLTTVLIRETLTALVVAGGGLAVVQTFFGVALTEAITDSLRRGDKQGIAPDMFAIFVSGVLLAGFILMTLAFRWRWGVGQQSNFAFSPNTTTFKLPISASYPYSVENAPSEWWMMLRHSISNSFWLRLTVLFGLFVFSSSIHIGLLELDSMVQLIAIGILGITAFEGDQTLNRYRFLADRGVVPWKLVVCRLAVVAVLASLVCAAFAIRVGRYPRGSMVFEFSIWLSPLAFLIGVFSSMCFRKSVMAMMAALVMCFVGFAATAAIIGWLQFEVQTLTGLQPNGNLDRIVLDCTPVASIVLLVAIFLMSKRWIVLVEPKLAPHYIWLTLTALLSPVFIACSFGFLMIPNVPWQETSSVNTKSSSFGVPVQLLSDEPILMDTIPHLSILSKSRGLGLEGVESAAKDAVYQVLEGLESKRNAPYQDLAEVIKGLLPPLEEMLHSPRVQMKKSPFPVEKIEHLIARTAALATIALQCHDSELALRLWRLNLELQEMAGENLPLITVASRNSAMHLLMQVSDADVQAMGGVDVFRSLIPSVSDERDSILLEALGFAKYKRNTLQGLSQSSSMHRMAITKYYPPIRWLNERQISYDLERRRGAVGKLAKNFLTEQSRSKLVSRFPQ